MPSRKVVDLRKRKPGSSGRHGAFMRPLSFKEVSSGERAGRRSPLRARRRRRKAIYALALLTLFITLAYGLSWSSYLPQFSIQDIHIVGTKALRPNLVRAYVETEMYSGEFKFISDANIFLFPREEIEQAMIRRVPRIRSVKIMRESLLANAITVSVEERENFAKWCEGETCFLMGETGFIFAPATSTEEMRTPYVFRGGIAASSAIGQQYLPNEFPVILGLLERLERASFSPREVVAESERDFSVRLEQGFELRASLGADPGALVKNLELALTSEPIRGRESQLEYIDLRFGNRMYYKFEGRSQQSAE